MFDALKNLFPGLVSVSGGGLSDLSLQSRWRRLEAAGREVELFVPAGPESVAGVVLFLHGHGEVLLSDNPVFTRLFQQHRLVAVCPSGRCSWWLDVLCEEFDPQVTPQQWLLQSLVPWIEQT
ncbi:MAG: hypothetical protein ACKPJJ_30800, partial [Planctomycetaceae bacterium]